MPSAPKNGYEPFDDLIRELRAEGHAKLSIHLHALLHQTAWTTGSELVGELGKAILEFEQSSPKVSSSLRRQIESCLGLVRRVWPEIR